MGKGFQGQGVGLTRQVEPYRFIDISTGAKASQETLRKLSDFVSGDSQVILRIPPDNSQAWEIVPLSANPHLIHSILSE